MKPRTLLISLVAAALAAAGAWYVFTPAPVAVEIATVVRGPLRVTLTEQGETRARERFVVTSPASGRVARIALREGDAVTAGQAVATLHVAPVSAAEREAQLARVAAAQAGVREAQELVKKAQSGLDQAVREQVRAERLVREGFIAPQAAEQARSAEAAARAERAAADARLRAAMAQAAAASASLTPADPSVASRPLALRAPAGGRVLRIPERSERVVAAGTPLLVIGDPHALEVVADFLSTDAVRIRPGMPAELTGWGGAAPVGASVRLVEPAAFTKVSALGVEEQRVNVVLDMPSIPAALGDGFRVEASIVVADVPDALKVPASAVFRAGGGRAVFVVAQGRAVQRAIEGGLANRDELEVRAGLAAGEAVVRYPTSALADGARVMPRP
jgi:HlyD family secretion protein